MGWPGIHTWVVGDAWPVTDANTYISTALVSVRRYQNSSAQIRLGSSGGNIFTTAETQIGSSCFNLMSSTADENYRMAVVIDLEASTGNGGAQGANQFTAKLYDQAGNVLVSRFNNMLDDWTQDMTLVGGASYGLATNNGFRITVTPGAATGMTFFWSAAVFFEPQV